MNFAHVLLYIVSKNYRDFTKAALTTEQAVHSLSESSRFFPVITRWEDILGLMRRAHEGEDPDLVLMELFANQKEADPDESTASPH